MNRTVKNYNQEENTSAINLTKIDEIINHFLKFMLIISMS